MEDGEEEPLPQPLEVTRPEPNTTDADVKEKWEEELVTEHKDKKHQVDPSARPSSGSNSAEKTTIMSNHVGAQEELARDNPPLFSNSDTTSCDEGGAVGTKFALERKKADNPERFSDNSPRDEHVSGPRKLARIRTLERQDPVNLEDAASMSLDSLNMEASIESFESRSSSRECEDTEDSPEDHQNSDLAVNSCRSSEATGGDDTGRSVQSLTSALGEGSSVPSLISPTAAHCAPGQDSFDPVGEKESSHQPVARQSSQVLDGGSSIDPSPEIGNIVVPMAHPEPSDNIDVREEDDIGSKDVLSPDSGGGQNTGRSGPSVSSGCEMLGSRESLSEPDTPDNESDSETDCAETVKPFDVSPKDDTERLIEEGEEDFEDSFYFDQNLNLEHYTINDMRRPERLDTVEEVSEPVSMTNSLPHDGMRWPSQNTSLTSVDIGASLTLWGDEDEDPRQSLTSTTSKEEMYSVMEMEVANPSIRLGPGDHPPHPSEAPTEGSFQFKQITHTASKDVTSAPRRNVFDKPHQLDIDEVDRAAPHGGLHHPKSFNLGHQAEVNDSSNFEDSFESVAFEKVVTSSYFHQASEKFHTEIREIRKETTGDNQNTKELHQSSESEKYSSISNQSVHQDSQHEQKSEKTYSEAYGSPTVGGRSFLETLTNPNVGGKPAESEVAKQLAQVKQEIYKLLSEDSSESSLDKEEADEEDTSLEEQIEFAELDSGLRGESEESSQSTDIYLRHERHEWDQGDKINVSMGCIGGEGKEHSGDSGIERMSSRASTSHRQDRAVEERINSGRIGDSSHGRPSSAGPNDAVGSSSWMARIGHKMRVRSSKLGSGGLSTASSSPDDRNDRPRSASVESPREGGFLLERPSSSLEGRVRELWIRLAQMETEKMKAVEEAVEAERRKLEDKNKKLEEERLREWRDLERKREEAEMKVKSALEAQHRQVDLMNKLQAKLVRYRNEAEEAKNVISELGNRNRDDLNTIAGLNAEVRDLEKKQHTKEILHKSEIQELQVKVEEIQERSKTYQDLNTILRQERDSLTQELTVSRSVISNLEAELTRSRRDLEQARTPSKFGSQRATNYPAEQLEKEALKAVNSLRKEHSNLRSEAVRSVAKMRVEMANLTRLATSACLEVANNSGVVRDRSSGRQVAVIPGGLEEAWQRLQAAIEDKRREEARADHAENERDAERRKVRQMERQLEEVKFKSSEGHRLQASGNSNGAENSDDRKEDSETSYLEERRVLVGRLEGENVLLRSSLQDIASMVAMDMETSNQHYSSEQTLHQGSLSLHSSPRRTFGSGHKSPGLSASLARAPRPITPTGRSPLLGAIPHRTRSASPNAAMMESTVTAVQAALNKRQTELYDLQARLAVTQDKLDQVTKSEAKWELKSREADKEIAKLQSEVSSLERRVQESDFRADELRKRLAALSKEKEAISEEHRMYKDRLDELESKKRELESSLDRLGRDKSATLEENKMLEERVAHLLAQLADRATLISQLEKVGSSLREETVELKERLAAVEKDQERLERERAETETFVLDEANLKTSSLQSEVTRLRHEETIFVSRLAEAETREAKVSAELAANKIREDDLRDELEDIKKKLSGTETEFNILKEELDEKTSTADTLSQQLRQARIEKSQLENQLTALGFRRDSLETKVALLTEEMAGLKEIIHELNNRNASLIEAKDQLEDKLSNKEREVKDLIDLCAQLEHNLEGEESLVEELKADLESAEKNHQDLLQDNDLKAKDVEQLNRQIVSLKAKWNETNTELTSLREEVASGFEAEKKGLERKVRKLEAERAQAMDDFETELETIRSDFEDRRKRDIVEWEHKMKEDRLKYEDELEYANQMIENLKTKHAESIQMAENTRQTSDRMVFCEERITNERLAELEAKLEDTEQRLTQERKDAVLALEKEKSTANQLRLEINRLKARLDDANKAAGDDRSRAQQDIVKLKADKDKADQQFFQLKERIREYEGRITDLEQELTDAKDKLSYKSEENVEKDKIVKELESKMSEKNQRIQEKILEKHKEVEVLEKKIEQFERSEVNLREELEELKEVHHISKQETDSSAKELDVMRVKNLELARQLELLKASFTAESTAKNKEANNYNTLKKKYDDLSYEKRKMEDRLKKVESGADETIQRLEAELNAADREVEALRASEGELEIRRHELDRQLNLRDQSYKELLVRLNRAETQLKDTTENLARLEATKAEYEAKINAVSTALHHHSRGTTPTRRHSRARYRSGESLARRPDLDEVDFIKNSLKDLSIKNERTEREKSELERELETLKKLKNQLITDLNKAEDVKLELEQKLNSSQLQLAKLEKKVSGSDDTLAEREEAVETLKNTVKRLEKKIRELQNDLTHAREDQQHAEKKLKESEQRERKLRLEANRLADGQSEVEERISRLESNRRNIETDKEKLLESLEEKDANIKILQTKVERLKDEVRGLEEHCGHLTGQLNKTQAELDSTTNKEREAHSQADDMQENLVLKMRELEAVNNRVEQLQHRIKDMEEEKQTLEYRLDNSKRVAGEGKRKAKEGEERVADLSQRLKEAERGRRDAEERLAQAGTNVGANNYLKDELSKARKENLSLHEQTKELEKKIKILKTEIKESTYSSSKSLRESSQKVVRTQIPPLSGYQPSYPGQECSDHLIKIHLLEQENERLRKRIQSLESTLRETEDKFKDRLEKMQKEGKDGREKDHAMHNKEIAQLRHQAETKEKLYKERINGLEDQVTQLKNHIGRDSLARRSFFATNQDIEHDMSELRRQLDQSLDAVHSAHDLEGSGLLERETSRLQDTFNRYNTSVANYSRISSDVNRSGAGVASMGRPLFRSPAGEFPPTQPSVIRRVSPRSSSMDNINRISQMTSTPMHGVQPPRPEIRSPLTSSRARRSLRSDFELSQL